ncbi:putative transferase CAF17, mitochondrial isoform X1 [Corapipo altera]|uniref:putative transferase CAF17, mitochondrial isoform X1 n=1 Tax=Corapipo altera TaxID=415028 RepID=UPI000FD6836E|nr:putative transferase CAF17, mitochondrial isoform X1 [Corapipo altera]
MILIAPSNPNHSGILYQWKAQLNVASPPAELPLTLGKGWRIPHTLFLSLGELRAVFAGKENNQRLENIRLHGSAGEEPHILLECDSTVLEPFQKHLKLYKIRRKVDISPCPDLSLWAVIPGEQAGEASSSLPKCAGQAVLLTPDPRAEVMGWRLITKKGANLSEIIPGSEVGDAQDYHRHRYKQGIPEGVKDLPPGVALPLESNLAYMNGISFTKGCYIGQELTARTHHMGVIRKRLLPVAFSAPLPKGGIPEGAEILTESGKPAGKFRAGGGDLGIALLRLAHMNEPLCIDVGGGKVKLSANTPEWWPKAAAK